MGVGNKRTLTKTRRKTRDVDQVISDLRSKKHLAQYKDTKLTQDLPGLGKNYCVTCSRWFDTPVTLVTHERGKPHKRRLKQLREESAIESKSGQANMNKMDMEQEPVAEGGVEMIL
ncbi:zinc finger protein [Trichoderma harzianum]|uniref:Zinc finger protein n=1 Tax=Trichoderma harzianum TaxID=5544 RepID=A0A0F9ZUK6_TRIHA|nr:zinc finger protein [Trichoderma harzianum]